MPSRPPSGLQPSAATGPQGAASAADVFDHDGLIELRAHSVGDDTTNGVGAAPALMPNVRDHGGKVIDLDTDAARTLVKYLKDGAELDEAAGLNPLVVRAVKTQGPLKADLVLSPDAGETLKAALKDKKVTAGVPVLVRL